MPQKPIFAKAPLMSVPYCFPNNGTVRVSDERISRLYQKASEWEKHPCLWEGLFKLACLLKLNPMEEPVVPLIYQAISDTDDGAIAGTVSEQISIARAAMSVFEYNTDRTILKRIALWFRYFEIEFDRLSREGIFLYQPADLMELMIRFYQITGMKSILRMCARLRAAAFDWTTALHTFQQSIPIQPGNDPVIHFSSKPDEMDYTDREKLINHAEMLADGVRFTLYAGIFSGHGHDLSSGKTAWAYLLKHHHALCGGTSANPYLCGCGPDQQLSNRALAAWAEAFASQTIMPDSEWALEELIRIAYNGLEDCINRPEVPESQMINSTADNADISDDPIMLYARITRAVAAVCHHSVALTQQGIRIQYLIPCRIILMLQKQPVILQMNEQKAVFHCKKAFISEVDYYRPGSSVSEVYMIRSGKIISRNREDIRSTAGIWLHSHGQWENEDGFLSELTGEIICEETHHHGVCLIQGNRLYSLAANKDQYAYAVSDDPVCQDGKTVITLQPAAGWRKKGDQPGDIPVFPEVKGEPVRLELTPYSQTPVRITMFPRTNPSCLK